MILEPNSETQTLETKSRGPLSNRNFRLLWFGESISLLGDQFYMIALPWLVLQLTGSGVAVGTVLALTGIPRALFMLVGGALTDRLSPRKVMLASNFIRLILVMMLTGLVLTETIELWMLYGFALFFGLADAFFFPAQGAIVPEILDDEQLEAGNSITQGTAQISVILGPMLAGLIIGMGAAPETLESGLAANTAPNLTGIGIAFAIDALTFLVSLASLWLISSNKKKKNDDDSEDAGVIAAIRSGLSYVWNDPILKPLFLLIAGINLLVTGPFAVGVPVLADRLPEGATALGIIMSAYGVGSLVGIILAGVLPKPPARRLGTTLLVVISVLGVMVASLGFMAGTLAAAVAMAIAGLADGYVVILTITWLQKRTPEVMLGRMMSLLMFASVGLGPVSQTIAGFLTELDLNIMFIGAGLMMTALTLWAATLPSLRAMGIETEAELETQTPSLVNLRSTAEMPIAD